MPDGFNQIIDIALLNNKLSFSELKDGVLHPVSWGISLSNKTGIMMIFLGLTWFFQEYITNQNIIQRYAATRNESEARKAMFISCLNIPIWAFFMFLGTALYAYFQVYPSDTATEMLIGTRNAEDIVPYFIINYLPAGISGLIIAAAIAAAMSSLDSSINSISTVSVHDIYRRHLVTNKNDIHYLHVAWYVATCATVIMIIGSCILAFSKINTLQDTYNTIGSVVMGGVLGLYLLGFCTKGGNEKSVWYGIVLTIMFSLWTVFAKYNFLPEWLQAPFDLYYTGILGQIVMFAGIFVATILLSDTNNNLKNLTIWTRSNK